ncbi:MAG TPA: glycerol kinase GlpK [Tepidisphaeraceae bacterium]|nr:glycerol kinase GlpK [Tepidisphaeraceae bacterium]
MPTAPRFVAAIDQGTTSTRCILFDRAGTPCASAQKEHRQIMPRPGWVEHDPAEIRDRTDEVIRGAMASAGATAADVAAVGVANQRETTVAWDKQTGEPLTTAIVWQDTRTDSLCRQLEANGLQTRSRAITGLPPSTYFSGPKMRWLLDNVPAVADAAREGRLAFGTIDSWVIWNLTGGPRGGRHVTDVTNASRTMLLDLHTLDYSPEMLAALGVPREALPAVTPSSSREPFGLATVDGPFGGAIPVCGNLGDQQAALVGQTCFAPGQSKNTYGTGCFMLLNTGTFPVPSRSGLLTTVGYKFGDAPAVYALEGSIAITGALVQWLRDQLGIIAKSADVEPLAASVADTGGVYFVPAFSGLFAPYWRSDARGTIVGMTRQTTKAHIARAALEATAYQTRDVLAAMNADSGVPLTALKVDGGMTANELLMQFQADVLGVPVIRPTVTETTALGAAYAAGLAVGFWRDLSEVQANWRVDRTFEPRMPVDRREALYADWKRAIERSLGWV